MGFDFGKVKDTKNIKTIDITYQYIVDEFNNLTNIYHTNYKMIDTGNFDYSLTFIHELSSDNNNNVLYLGGTYTVNMEHLIDNKKYLYTIIPIQTIEAYLNISPTLSIISGDPQYIEKRLAIMDRLKQMASMLGNTENKQQTEDEVLAEAYNNMMERLDPFPHLHEYSHCLVFNKLIVDTPVNIIFKDSPFIKALYNTKIYNTTHIIIAGYFDYNTWMDLKYTFPGKYINEYSYASLNSLIVIGILVFEIPYVPDEEMYKTQIAFKLAWEETLKKYNATHTKSTRIFNTTFNEVVKKYDPPAEDLTYTSINVIDPAKIFNINII